MSVQIKQLTKFLLAVTGGIILLF